MTEDPRLVFDDDFDKDGAELRRPVLVGAFRGWNDAGDAASFAADYLKREWNARRVAAIDPEEFFDFQAVRPNVRLHDGITRTISWPSNELFLSRDATSDHDILLFIGTEPNLKWRTFTNMLVDLARRLDIELVVTLGALLADVPHSRPVPITGTAVDNELIERLRLQRSRYEGPTGIVGVLQDACRNADIPAASLWAAIPHYLAVSPNPKAALALVEAAIRLIGAPVAVDALARATVDYERQVGEMVEGDDDVAAYVRLLEERADEREEDAREELDPGSLPSGDALAAELENFLRQRNDRGESD